MPAASVVLVPLTNRACILRSGGFSNESSSASDEYLSDVPSETCKVQVRLRSYEQRMISSCSRSVFSTSKGWRRLLVLSAGGMTDQSTAACHRRPPIASSTASAPPDAPKHEGPRPGNLPERGPSH